MLPNPTSPLITIGQITGAFGVRGWVRLTSFTAPQENLFTLKPIYLEQQGRLQLLHVTTYQAHQKTWVAQFTQCADRDIALSWRGAYLKIERTHLPELPETQYYWTDLENMAVVNTQNELLGHVEHLLNTGANDIMAVKKGSQQFYVPFVQPHIVKNVDLEKKIITVDWDETL